MVRTISMVARQSWSFLYDNGDPRDYGDDFKTTHTTFTTHYNLWPQWVWQPRLLLLGSSGIWQDETLVLGVECKPH